MKLVWFFFREIVLGDWKISTNPDCARKNKKRCVPKKIVRKVGKIIKHEDFQPTDPRPKNITDGEYYRNDIALIRLNEAVPLFNDNPSQSFVLPVCLPWPEYVEDDHPAFDIKEFKSKNKPIRNDFVITGWGKRFKDNKLEKPSEQTFSDSLLKAKVPVTNSIEGCAKHLIDSTQICAGGIEGPLLNSEYSDFQFYLLFSLIEQGAKIRRFTPSQTRLKIGFYLVFSPKCGPGQWPFIFRCYVGS